MTVAELIAQLQEMPQDAVVQVPFAADDGWWPIGKQWEPLEEDQVRLSEVRAGDPGSQPVVNLG